MTITSLALELPERIFPQRSITAEEKLRQERRERRHLRRKGPPSQYHHTPCSAALDFARTTTPEPLILEKVHKLARPVLEYYTRESPCDLRRSKSLIPEFTESKACSSGVVAPKAGEYRASRRKATQRSLEISLYDQLSSSLTHNCSLKTGGDLSFKNLHRVPSHHRRQIAPLLVGDRPDWTEQDECLDPQHPSIFSKIGPLLQRSESIWSVRHGTSKHIERVTTRDDDSVLKMRKCGKFGYPWSCVCFL